MCIRDSTNVVAESNETNNWVSTPLTLTAATKDLVIVSGTPTVDPVSALPGGVVEFSPWTMKNQGTADINDQFYNAYYLSTDATITDGDTILISHTTVSLAAGVSKNFPAFNLTIPADTVPGSYFIGTLADRTNLIAESNETNNWVLSLIHISEPTRPY